MGSQNYDKESDAIQNPDVLFMEYGISRIRKPRKEVFNKNNENIDNQEVKANDVPYKITYKDTSDRGLNVTVPMNYLNIRTMSNGPTAYDDFAHNRLTWRRKAGTRGDE